MSKLTKNQEKTLREFLHEAVVPLIEDVLVKKLGQAMSYAKEQIDTPKREWVGLTVDEILNCYKDNLDRTMFVYIVQTIEAKLKEKNT